MAASRLTPPVTPDERYIVVRGRLWRRANPNLPEVARKALVAALMDARRAVKAALQQSANDLKAGDLAKARAQVDAAKVALGERGPVWWDDGSPDYNRHMAHNTPYAGWYEGLQDPPRVVPPADNR